MMYQCGQQLVYGIHGVCQIVDIETKVVNKKKIEYYVLEPVIQPGARFYVPMHNEAAVSKLCPIMTTEELDELLNVDVACKDVWIANENERKNHYRTLINSGDRLALLRMVFTLYKHKQEQTANGRKFHQADENFLRDAKKLLEAEISVILDMEQKDVETYIQNALAVK